MKNTFICLPIVALMMAGCSADDGISPIPEIAFVSATPQSVTAYMDSLTVTISYRDGDGDLGKNDTDQSNLFMTDSRNGVEYGFRVRQLAPDGATISISGNLNIVVPIVPIIGNENAESFNYSIRVVDRAGNESNTVTSSAIVVNR